MVRIVSCHLPPFQWRICRHSSLTVVWWSPSLTLWRTLFMHFSAWRIRGLRRTRRADSSGRCQKLCTRHTSVSALRVCGGWTSLPRASSILGRLPLFLDLEGGKRCYQRREHNAQAEGWSQGSRSGLRRGCSQLTPCSPSVVDGPPWWLINPYFPLAWVVRG